MEKDIDILTGIGKRMPYTVPDGFFADMEKGVMASLPLAPTKPPRGEASRPSPSGEKEGGYPLGEVWWGLKGVLLAVAASIILFFAIRAIQPNVEQLLSSPDDFAGIELAFNSLSADDQDYLIGIYEDEEFIDEFNYYEEEL